MIGSKASKPNLLRRDWNACINPAARLISLAGTTTATAKVPRVKDDNDRQRQKHCASEAALWVLHLGGVDCLDLHAGEQEEYPGQKRQVAQVGEVRQEAACGSVAFCGEQLNRVAAGNSGYSQADDNYAG